MQTKTTRRNLISAQDTAAEMVRLVRTYHKDLGALANLPLPEFFNLVKNLPYRPDPKNIESIARPRLTLRPAWPWRDCDDKAILLASWAYSNFVPFRFIATAAKKNIPLHHIFIELQGDKNIFLDGTYSKNIFGETPKFFKIVSLTPWVTNMYNPQIQILEGAAGLGFNPFKNTGRKVKNLTRQTKNVGKKAGKLALKAVKAITPPIPSGLKKSAAKIVKKIVGTKELNTATKAAIIAPATAAVLAIPGMQIYAAAVPVLINEILDQIIKDQKKKPAKAAPAENLTIAEKKAAAIAAAKQKAGSLKVKKLKKGAEILPAEMQPVPPKISGAKIALLLAAGAGTIALLARPKK